MTKSITILQHNVLNWWTNKTSVIDSFLRSNPEFIIINSHGFKDTEPIKIPEYTIHKINSTGELQEWISYSYQEEQ